MPLLVVATLHWLCMVYTARIIAIDSAVPNRFPLKIIAQALVSFLPIAIQANMLFKL